MFWPDSLLQLRRYHGCGWLSIGPVHAFGAFGAGGETVSSVNQAGIRLGDVMPKVSTPKDWSPLPANVTITVEYLDNRNKKYVEVTLRYPPGPQMYCGRNGYRAMKGFLIRWHSGHSVAILRPLNTRGASNSVLLDLPSSSEGLFLIAEIFTRLAQEAGEYRYQQYLKTKPRKESDDVAGKRS